MRPIVFDGNPKFECVPATAEALQYSKDIDTALDYESELIANKHLEVNFELDLYIRSRNISYNVALSLF